MMETTNYSDFRKNLKMYMDKVNEEAIPYLVTSQNGQDVVVLSKKDFDALMETQYLLATKVNRDNLSLAMEELDKGDVVVEEI